MRRLTTYVLVRLSTRRCRGCDSTGPHTHHLTWIGRRRYTGSRPFPLTIRNHR